MADSYYVKVRYPTEDGEGSFELEVSDETLHPLAMRLRYVVANRARINDETRDELEDLVEQQIREMFTEIREELNKHLKGIGAAGAVEIEIPFTTEKIGWAARMMPWENVLGLMTRRHRSREPLLVVRYLNRNKENHKFVKPDSAAGRKSLLVVQADPGQLSKRYHLNEECEQVRDGYEDESNTQWSRSVFLPNPTLGSLREKVSGSIRSAHLAGVCAASVVQEQDFQMYQIQDQEGFEKRPMLDGFIVRSDSTEAINGAGRSGVHPVYQVVGAVEMAKALCGDRKDALQLVSFSSNFSAPRLAALAIGLGAASHAIGIQDTVSEEQCGQFFGGFDSDWNGDGSDDILKAFFRSRRNLARNYDLVSAASFVLWSSESLISSLARVVQQKSKSEVPERKTPPAYDPEPYVSHWVKPVTGLNYSLLHNDQPLFEQFSVLKVKTGWIKPLAVEVSLDTGGHLGRSVCRVTLPAKFSKYVYRLADRIRLPLVADLMRRCQESVRTNLHVRLTCGDDVLLEDNYPVHVLPADEWRDDGRDHCWLPSFVLPRDEAVLQIFDRAQRCLRILADDCAAAFDGYQRVAPGAPETVELQVKAIWAAIQHDLRINYFNPPPSYGTSSQRLRTPSQILQGSSATCIDISLLFCACLEYAGIYPVIFLIEGHAFPGYWRSESAWWEMVSFRRALSLADQAGLSENIVVAGASKGWVLEGEMAFSEVINYVEDGTLVPFEATFATMGRRLIDALEEAPQNLTAESFDCMVDIWSARMQRVTPLPLVKFVP